MLSDDTWTYTWQNGRQLASMTNGTTTASFTYNGDGIRSTKTANGKTWQYTYDGDKLTHMYDGTRYLHFRYEGGRPFSFYYNNGTDTRNYYYLWNAQGDCIGITSADGTHLVEYTYDAWGNITSISGISANTLALYNPFRYRGYVYDDETGLYYLQSRYYNPEMGRFINADGYVATGQGILGNNMFVYCGNNPVNRYDESGEVWHIVAGAVIGAVTGVFTNLLDDLADGKVDNNIWTYVVAGTVGAVEGALTVAIPGAAIAISAAASAIETSANGIIEGKKAGEILIETTIAAGLGAVTGSWGSKIADSKMAIDSGIRATKTLYGSSRKFVSKAAEKSLRHTINKTAKLIAKEWISSMGESSVIWIMQKVAAECIKKQVLQ